MELAFSSQGKKKKKEIEMEIKKDFFQMKIKLLQT